jgi:hypothetical protein
MAISDSVKVGDISLGTMRQSNIELSICGADEKRAYVTEIARISVGESYPEADAPVVNCIMPKTTTSPKSSPTK